MTKSLMPIWMIVIWAIIWLLTALWRWWNKWIEVHRAYATLITGLVMVLWSLLVIFILKVPINLNVLKTNSSMIEIQDQTYPLFQRAVAARRRRLFPEVEEFSRCKFFSGNDFNSNGKKQTRPERKPFQVSNSVSFYRFRSHRSIRKNLRRTIRFDIKFRYIVPNILQKIVNLCKGRTQKAAKSETSTNKDSKHLN